MTETLIAFSELHLDDYDTIFSKLKGSVLNDLQNRFGNDKHYLNEKISLINNFSKGGLAKWVIFEADHICHENISKSLEVNHISTLMIMLKSYAIGCKET